MYEIVVGIPFRLYFTYNFFCIFKILIKFAFIFETINISCFMFNISFMYIFLFVSLIANSFLFHHKKCIEYKNSINRNKALGIQLKIFAASLGQTRISQIPHSSLLFCAIAGNTSFFVRDMRTLSNIGRLEHDYKRTCSECLKQRTQLWHIKEKPAKLWYWYKILL